MTTKGKLFRVMLATSTAFCAIAGVTAPARSQVEAPPQKSFNIPAQSAVTGISELARQADVQILASEGVVRGKQTRAVSGTMTIDAALRHMLAGTGLAVQASDGRTFTLGRAGDVRGESVGDSGSGQGPARGDEIIVTGTRIARKQYNSPAPVAVRTEKDIERTGESRIFDVLGQMPQFGVGDGPTNTQFYGQDVGGQFVNLRGLGAGRTLTVIDGQRRVSGASATSAVDLSSIPANMVARTEVVTGGAAAIYGADAVSGVVNLLLREDVDGLELTMRQGLTSRGDAYSYSYGGLLGGALGDRGRFTIGVSYNHDDELPLKNRSWSKSWSQFGINPADTGPNDGIFDNKLYPNARVRTC